MHPKAWLGWPQVKVRDEGDGASVTPAIADLPS